MIFYALGIVFEIEVEQQLTDENPRTMLRRDHIRMLTEPTESGTHGPRLVHRRLNVHTYFTFGTRFLFLDPREQRQEFLFDDVVIIVAPRITRDFSGRKIRLVLVRRKVVERDDDDRARLRKDFRSEE